MLDVDAEIFDLQSSSPLGYELVITMNAVPALTGEPSHAQFDGDRLVLSNGGKALLRLPSMPQEKIDALLAQQRFLFIEFASDGANRQWQISLSDPYRRADSRAKR